MVKFPGGIFEADKQVRVTNGAASEVAILTVPLPFAMTDTSYRVFPVLVLGRAMTEFMKEYDVELMIANKTTTSFMVVIHRGSFGFLGASSAWDVDIFMRGEYV